MPLTQSLTTEALNDAYQRKVAELYNTIFAAQALAGNDAERISEAEQAFSRGLALAKLSLEKTLQLADA